MVYLYTGCPEPSLKTVTVVLLRLTNSQLPSVAKILYIYYSQVCKCKPDFWNLEKWGAIMAIPLTNSVPLTGDARIDGLIQGGKWSSGNLSFDLWDTNYGTWGSFATEIVTVAFQWFSKVANINFTDLTFNENIADISIFFSGDLAQTTYGAVALGMFPDVNFTNQVLLEENISRSEYPTIEGDIFLDNYASIFNYSQLGGTGFSTIIHEIGHALGLKHPHDDGGNDRPTFAELGIDNLDNQFFTIMSYNEALGSSPSYDNPATPMLLDVLALQNIYGANMNYNIENNSYEFIDDGISATLWDAGGLDTINSSQSTKSVTINLSDGAFSNAGQTVGAIAYGAIIENAVGSTANDELYGNTVNNKIWGNLGNDTIFGYEGNDSLYGGIGNDFVQGNKGSDLVFGEGGNDTVRGGKQEDAVFGESGNDFVAGDRENDQVYGGTGNDTLRGGKDNDNLFGEAGDDILYGDKGNDIMWGGNGADVFVFKSDSGIDIIKDYSSIEDGIAISSNIFTTSDQALAAFDNGILDFGNGNFVTIENITNLDVSDFIIF